MGDYLVPPVQSPESEQMHFPETQEPPQGYYQVFDELPLGVLTSQPRLGRWFCLRKAPEVVLNPFRAIPGIPSDHKQGILFPPGCEFVSLCDAPFYGGVIRLRCVRGADSPAMDVPSRDPQKEGGKEPKPKPKLEEEKKKKKRDAGLSMAYVSFTVENQLNEVLAAVRYGLRGFVEISRDGCSYVSTGVLWSQNDNNYFSITVDLNTKTWRVYFKNAVLDEVFTDPLPIGPVRVAAISHLRVLNGNTGPSYSLDMGTGVADLADHFGIRFDRRLRIKDQGLSLAQ